MEILVSAFVYLSPLLALIFLGLWASERYRCHATEKDRDFWLKLYRHESEHNHNVVMYYLGEPGRSPYSHLTLVGPEEDDSV